jgi:hypothetical protein
MPTIPRARWRDLPTPLAIVVTVFALLAIAGLLGKIHTAPAAAVQLTPGLIILIATLCRRCLWLHLCSPYSR